MPRTNTRRPTSANGGLPPTRCRVSSSRPAAGAGGLGGAGALGALGVLAGAVGVATISAAADAGATTKHASTAQRAARRLQVIGGSYACGRAMSASGAIRPSRLQASTTAPIPASALTISTGTCQPQPSRLENAIELFSEWAIMHGYSEPV